MKIDGIGIFSLNTEYDWYYSDEISIPVLDGQKCRFVLEGYDESEDTKYSYKVAIHNFLSINKSILHKADKHIFAYYKAMEDLNKKYNSLVKIKKDKDVWDHIKLGNEPMVSRRSSIDDMAYISFECSCDWEREHGLQIVFKNGLEINKIGPYDGHLTNSDAFAKAEYENIVFVDLTN